MVLPFREHKLLNVFDLACGMTISNQDIAKLEARLRAIEVLLQHLPDVISKEILEKANAEISDRRYRHPCTVTKSITAAEKAALEEDALSEIWRQMKD